MEAVHDPEHSSVSWVARLVEVLQPLTIRADRLAAMQLFAGLRWSDLEFAADLLEEVEVDRGARLTVQGRPTSRLLFITEGEALVSANARPLRVVGFGEAVGIAGLVAGRSPETTIALTPIRALAANQDQFNELVGRQSIRHRLDAAIPARRHRSRRLSSEAASATRH